MKLTDTQHAFTLVELVVAMLIASIIMVAAASAIVLASRAMPTAQDPSSAAILAAAAASPLAAELEAAIYIMEHSQNAVAFTVADRDGDGRNERIRYAWSGTPGDPLTRQYNGGAVVAAVDDVDRFALVPEIRSVTESYPGAGIEDAADSSLASQDSGTGLGNLEVESGRWPGQHFAPVLAGNAMGWRPTRVRLMIRKNSVNSFLKVQVRPAGADLKPTSAVLDEQTVDGSLLLASYGWQEFTFGAVDRLAAADPVCLVLAHLSGTKSATAQTNAGSGLVTSADQGLSWTYNSTKSLRGVLYGKATLPGPTQYAVTQHLMAMRIILKVSSVGRQVDTTAQIMNQPPLLLGFWEADFSSSPTALDANGDGAADWAVVGGGPLDPSSIYGGAWHTSGTTLRTWPDCDFVRRTVAEVRMRSASVGAAALATVNADRSGGVCAPLTAALRLEPEGTQTLTVSRKKGDGTSETLIAVGRLPADFVAVRLLIDPSADSVCVKVGDTLVGTYAYGTPAWATADRFASLSASGGPAEFDYAHVRVLEPMP
ncbi:MAG: prepilin-type N-terminal cleavage/methylation domain-containing protein [Planctomycetes bacterium]|nr:prepilin-type N-terminal cleavage/methylation domain-containing protein [Planctomycetota bacterium]